MELCVREFHEKYSHFITDKPNAAIPENVMRLRIKLIDEEQGEMHLAMLTHNIVEIADGGADLLYVVIGTMITYNIPVDRVFMEVHRSNMTKTAIKAEAGEKYGTKTPKGLDYIAPDILGILTHPEKLTHLETLALCVQPLT